MRANIAALAPIPVRAVAASRAQQLSLSLLNLVDGRRVDVSNARRQSCGHSMLRLIALQSERAQPAERQLHAIAEAEAATLHPAAITAVAAA